MAFNLREGLTTKLGPFPGWVYGAGLGGAVAFFMWRRSRNKTVSPADAEFSSNSQYVGWGASPYTTGAGTGGYDNTGGGVDMSAVFDSITAMSQSFTDAQLQPIEDNANRFEQFQTSFMEERVRANEELQRERELRAAELDRQRQIQEDQQQRFMDMIVSQTPAPAAPAAPAPPPDYAPPPPAATPPAAKPPAAKPAAPAKPAKGTLLWNGPKPPDMATLQKAHPGVALKKIENTGHKPGSSHRWIVVVA